MNNVSEILENIKRFESGPPTEILASWYINGIMKEVKELLESHIVIERQTIEEVVCVLEIEGRDFEREILQAELDRLNPAKVKHNGC